MVGLSKTLFFMGVFGLFSGCSEGTKKCQVYWVNILGPQFITEKSCKEVSNNTSSCGYHHALGNGADFYCIAPILVQEVQDDAK